MVRGGHGRCQGPRRAAPAAPWTWVFSAKGAGAGRRGWPRSAAADRDRSRRSGHGIQAAALIVVDPRAIRSVPGMSVVRVAAGRAFLAFDEGRGLADLELAIFERLQEATIDDAVRRELRAVHRQVRDWRRERGFRFSKRSIILVERVRSSRRRRAPARSAAIPGAGSAATGP